MKLAYFKNSHIVMASATLSVVFFVVYLSIFTKKYFNINFLWA